MKPVSPGRLARSRGGQSGFSVVEGIGGLVVFALLMGALTYGMGSLFSEQAQPQVAFGQQAYARAPSFDNFRDAVDLHAAFSNAVDQADSVIVLGGARSHPTLDPNGPSSALSASFEDCVLTAAAAGGGLRAYSSWDQRQLNFSQFSAYFTASPDPADFTILTVQGLSRITSITQQRRHRAVVNGQDLALYEVTYQPVDWSSGMPSLPTNASTGTRPAYSYRVYYAAAEDVWSLPPGATHYWYRADTAWTRDHEGPSRVVFADPYALAGQDGSSPVSPMSRFIYFLAQQR